MITDSIVSDVINTIVSGYEPEKIIIFGSCGKNEQTNDSDLDLLIVKETNETYYMRPRVVRSLFSRQPCAMDILVYTPDEFEKRKYLLNNIVNIAFKTGKLVYERCN